jgi:uncharacterized protein YacL (UPF0231 family)
LKKRILFSLLVSVMLLLAACGNDKNAKEAVVDALKDQMNVENFDATLGLDLDVQSEGADAETQMILDFLNSAEFSLDIKYDAKAEKQEATINLAGEISPISFDVSVPFLFDIANNKMYLGTDSLVENFGPLMGITDEFKGKLIEMDLEAYADEFVPTEDAEMENAQDAFFKALEKKDEADFTKDGDKYTVTFDQEGIKQFIKDFALAFDDTLTEDDLAYVDEELDYMFETVAINKLELVTTLDGDDVKEQAFVVDVTYTDEYSGAKSDIKAALALKYNSVNKDVKFNINPDDYEIINYEELMNMFYGF